MSYRNDHDAAIARVEALQNELARAESKLAEAEVPSPSQPRMPRAGLVIAASLVALALGIAGGVMVGIAAEPQRQSGTASVEPVDRPPLPECAALPDAEETVSNVTSLAETHFASDPARLDTDATVPQLLLEYERAHAARDRLRALCVDGFTGTVR